MSHRFLASIVLGFVATNTLLGTSTALALTDKTSSPTLRPGSISVSSTASATTKLSYKQKVILANAMVQSAKANKESLSFVQAMRKINATTVAPLTMVNATVFSDRRKRIEVMNIIRKAKTTTSITPTSTTVPVLNSAPVVSSGGGSSSSIASATPVTTPSVSTTTAPVVTTIVPVATPAPIVVAPTAPAPVASVVVAPTAPAPVAPVVVAPTAPAPVAPVVVAPTAPVAPVVVAPTAPVAPVVVAPTAPAPVTTPTGTTPINIVSPQNPNLAKLAEYQRVMGGFVADNLMIFMNMPQSAAGIDGASYYMANIMNEYAKYGITPIFVFEPTGDNGAQLDLGKLKNGDYSANMELLFSKIKNDRKVTEDKLGLMIPYPEINTPAFNRANFVPENLPIMVNIFFDSIKKSYPNVKGGLLLDAKSYDVDKSWGQGVARSFAPYIRGIKPGYIQTFGLQGFPWASNDASVKVYDPTVFLPTGITAEAANILGTKNIWFNTGTMKRQYPTNTVNVSPAERTTTYNGIINQATALQSQGYTMMVHIFAQNKFSMGEGIDWSYIENAGDGVLSAHEGVFATFLKQAQSKGLKVGLFDI